MKAIKNNRIVVIDDTRNEVKQLLKSLNKHGAYFNYYYENADKDNLPNAPLKNVRILFLDFVLNTDSQQDKTKISAVLSVLTKIIHIENGPYIILAWTKHNKPQDNLISLFKEELMKSTVIPKPISILEMDKVGTMNNLNKINQDIESKFSEDPIIKIMLNWESYVHDSVTDVMNTLVGVSTPSSLPATFDEHSSALNDSLERHLGKFARSALGTKSKKNKGFLIASQFGLNNFLLDHIENRIQQKDTPEHNKFVDRSFDKSQTDYTEDDRSLMNGSFSLISNNLEKGQYPGNIYSAENIFKNIICKKKKCYCNKLRLTRGQILQDFSNNNTIKVKQLTGVIPIMLDTTPVCDFAQEKSKYSNLLLGVLWPVSIQNLMKKTNGSLYDKYLIKYNNKSYYLTFNSNRLSAFHLDAVNTIKPILRARKELLTDIHHWLAKQISRPGKTEFI